ncbi:hypothetical protein KP509_1Z004400 [Ceratopteris richardii]|nr:hypothetical protein KP509_1Z004400 [Ceratopteris richardii]
MDENGGAVHTHGEGNVDEEKVHDPSASLEHEGAEKDGRDLKGQKRKAATTVTNSSGDKSSPKKAKTRDPGTPSLDRPARERKSIDRFADSVEIEKEKPKEFKIEQGSGDCLRDIPNVVFKLSKKKSSDEPIQLLHRLLYNKRAKPHVVKTNILQFSGYVWGPNEEKEKAKVREKLDKCFKETLIQLSDLLDLNMPRTSKKEDIVSGLLDFLQSPQKTTDKLFQEEEQRLKEKKRSKSPAKGKKKKKTTQTPRKRQKHEKTGETNKDDAVAAEQEEEQASESLEKEKKPAKKKSTKGTEQEEEASEASEKGKKPVNKSTKGKEKTQLAKSESVGKPSKKSSKKIGAPDEVKPVDVPEETDKLEVETEHHEDLKQKLKRKEHDDDSIPRSPSKSPKKTEKKKSVHEPSEENVNDDVKDVKSKPLSKVSKVEPPKDEKVAHGGSGKEKQKSEDKASAGSGKVKKKSEEKAAVGGSGNEKKNSLDRGVVGVPAKEKKTPKEKMGTGVTGKGNKKPEEKATTENSDEGGKNSEVTKGSSVPHKKKQPSSPKAPSKKEQNADEQSSRRGKVANQSLKGAKFNVDLSQNKAHVKNLIQEEISKIVDEDDGESDDDGEEDNENETGGVSEREEKLPAEPSTEVRVKG